MKDFDVIQSLNNAWIALAKCYEKSPSENSRIAINCVRDIMLKVNSDYKKSQNKESQISIDEWLRMLCDEK